MNRYFREKVEGLVGAELLLDAQGNPIIHQGENLNHYEIRIFLNSANPNIRNVIYRLDRSYYDSLRESDDREKQYEIRTTTYGDYPLIVDVQIGNELVREKQQLSALLFEKYKGTSNAEIIKALDAIKTH